MSMEKKGFKILIADDEADILEILSYNIAKEGYEVILASDGNEAIEKAKKYQPDLLLLDMLMPYKSGMEVCQILRQLPEFHQTLIVFLTALNDDAIQVRGLENGADDYLMKPISPKVLITKINTLFRRLQQQSEKIANASEKIIQHDNIIIDPTKFIVVIDEQEYILAKKEFELLYLLASYEGRVFLRDEILSQVWGTEVIVGDRTIDVHIRKIRQKLNIDCIKTVKGVGYKFEW